MTRRMSAAVAGVVAVLAGAANAAAQNRLQDRFFGGGDGGFTDIASAGNGGVATASANGGAVSIGDVDTWGGPVFVDGGSVGNVTDLGITANGGTAIADASGGDYNLAFVS